MSVESATSAPVGRSIAPSLNICLHDLGELTEIRERMLFHATLVSWVVNPIPLQEACMRSVVVTGTSTGIGWGIAKVLTAKGFRVFGSVRKKTDAERLSAELGSRFVPLLFDVADEAAVHTAAAEVRAALDGETLAGLVNNASIAVAGPLLKLPIDKFRWQIDVNLVGAVIVIQAFAALLGTDRQLKGKPGRIVNISSVGGRVATPRSSGSKACPRAFALGRRGLPPKRLGPAVMNARTTSRPKVRYAVTPQPLQDWLGRNLPKRLIDRMIGGWLGLLPARQ
jgi:NADP-dependent 3-hydroxy acid dehydrogenase YdfG